MKTIAAKSFLLILIAAAVLFVVAYSYTIIRDLINSNIKVTVPEAISIVELYDRMQDEGEFAALYELGSEGVIEYIIFPLDGANIIKVTAEDRVIQVYTAKENWWQDIGFRQLTRQWSNILDSYQGKYQPLLEDIAAEIRRITGGE